MENYKLKNEIAAKTEKLKEMRKEIDSLKTAAAENRVAWNAKEAEYTLKIDTLQKKRVENKDEMYLREYKVIYALGMQMK